MAEDLTPQPPSHRPLAPSYKEGGQVEEVYLLEGGAREALDKLITKDRREAISIARRDTIQCVSTSDRHTRFGMPSC
jgi:hypothetical protein